MQDFLYFFVFQILDKAPLFLGLIALVGLLLQKKKPTDIADGVIKTIVGILVLSTGAGVLMKTLFPIRGRSEFCVS
ncbi:PTS transporter subunit IIC [Vibrio rumoiensis]|uniref:PTS transporter subunit IIC n=1 Tax=Vibrio rumoiensis TaxID=76258 RepID=UPI001E5E6B40|nr:PTS transporter subunit IIC [Vibrio rumoiensis]